MLKIYILPSPSVPHLLRSHALLEYLESWSTQQVMYTVSEDLDSLQGNDTFIVGKYMHMHRKGMSLWVQPLKHYRVYLI